MNVNAVERKLLELDSVSIAEVRQLVAEVRLLREALRLTWGATEGPACLDRDIESIFRDDRELGAE